MSDASEVVSLRDGPTVRVAAVLLLLDLEARGFQVGRDGDDIVIRPFSKLTQDDRNALSLWKPEVLALVDYEAPEIA